MRYCYQGALEDPGVINEKLAISKWVPGTCHLCGQFSFSAAAEPCQHCSQAFIKLKYGSSEQLWFKKSKLTTMLTPSFDIYQL